ncbi:MAG: hypothetical protein U0326_41420 [Polyangiales bacterium]
MNTSLASPRTLVAAAFVAASSLALSGCPKPAPEGDDLFRVAVNGVPGGALLSAWGGGGQAVFLAGGFVSVDPARLAGTGMSAGRLVEYAPGRFTTRCRTDAALWWVHGVVTNNVTTEVWAAGDGGTVLRYRNGNCEVLPLGITFPEGAPTLWGLWAQAPDDVWFVGGSPQPTGPKGVLLHYDGARFERVEGLPEFARTENLYKITRSGDQYAIVGSGGVALAGTGRAFAAIETGVMTTDNRLFTASCADSVCVAVGGVAAGLVLTGTSGPASLRVNPQLAGVSGLNGAWAQDAQNIFVVGVNGFTMHVRPSSFAFFQSYAAPSRTFATLHGVGGNRNVVLAVGGELDDRSSTQRAVVLVRGDDAESFSFDGRTYNAEGSLRRSLGGSGQ